MLNKFQLCSGCHVPSFCCRSRGVSVRSQPRVIADTLHKPLNEKCYQTGIHPNAEKALCHVVKLRISNANVLRESLCSDFNV